MPAKKQKMSLTPPKIRSAEEFVKGAGDVSSVTDGGADTAFPWEDERVRDDVIKSINLRLPEPYILKLQYLSETTHMSQQALIRDVLLPAIDRQIEKLSGRS